jgi:hypothetical protein
VPVVTKEFLRRKFAEYTEIIHAGII